MSHLLWARGGEATLVSIEGDMVKLVSSVPWPPGSRHDAALVAAPGVIVKIKVHGSRRLEDASFAIEGRAFDMTREVRARLEALVSREPTAS